MALVSYKGRCDVCRFDFIANVIDTIDWRDIWKWLIDFWGFFDICEVLCGILRLHSLGGYSYCARSIVSSGARVIEHGFLDSLINIIIIFDEIFPCY